MAERILRFPICEVLFLLVWGLAGIWVRRQIDRFMPFMVLITVSGDGRFSDNGAVRVLIHGRKIKITFPGAGYDIKYQSLATMTMGFNEDEMRRQ